MPKKTTTADETKVLMYKGKPMQRRDNKIYYGDFSKGCFVEFTITSTKKVGDLDVATNVIIELKETHNFGKDKSFRKAERENLYKAIDIGEYWLRDALNEV